MNAKLIVASLVGALTLVGQGSNDPDAGKIQTAAVLLISNSTSSGTGFACVYKNREFVATNLHVIGAESAISVKSQSGDDIALSGKLIAAEDADICLLSIVGTFADRGIVPLQFVENVFKE